MGVFDYNSFSDLSQVFDLIRGQVVPPTPKARVVLYATTAIRAGLPQSKFADLNALLPRIKPRFSSSSARKNKPEIVSAAFQQSAEEPKKARPILKLKTRVEMPVLTTISRRSTTQDLAALFKAEMALMEKKTLKGLGETHSAEDMLSKKRRHPLSHKPWSELFAEVEMSKESKRNFDLAAAFKTEMRAFMAEQEKTRTADAEPVRLKTAMEPKTMSPSRTQAQFYRRSTAKNRILAA